MSSRSLNEAAAKAAPAETPSRPSLERAKSSSSSAWASMKKAFSTSTSGGRSTHSSSATTPGAATPRFLGSRQNSIPDSSELQSILQGNSRPDLSAVNRALEQLHSLAVEKSGDPKTSNQRYIDYLRELANVMVTKESRCKTILDNAVIAHKAGKYEMCRGMCWTITRDDSDADLKTRICAFNMLATLSQPPQARRYLDRSRELVDRLARQDQDHGRLSAAISMLRDGIDGGKGKEGLPMTREEVEALELPG